MVLVVEKKMEKIQKITSLQSQLLEYEFEFYYVQVQRSP